MVGSVWKQVVTSAFETVLVCVWLFSFLSLPLNVGFFASSSHAGLVLTMEWAFTELSLAYVNAFNVHNYPVSPLRKMRLRKVQQFAWAPQLVSGGAGKTGRQCSTRVRVPDHCAGLPL